MASLARLAISMANKHALRSHRGYMNLELKEQDDAIDEIGVMVGELHNSSKAIENEIDDGNAELLRFQQDVGAVEKRFDRISAKMKKMLETDGIYNCTRNDSQF